MYLRPVCGIIRLYFSQRVNLPHGGLLGGKLQMMILVDE